jgi:predicted ATP-grasp superfamily ATP-dependent carboligase
MTTSFWSRFTQRRILAPLASENPFAFGLALLDSLEKEPSETVIFPMEDSTLTWIAEHREILDRTRGRILIPNLEPLRIAQDKGKTIRHAQSLGIPCPGTREPPDISDFINQISNLDPDQFIVKPRIGTGSAGFTTLQSLNPTTWHSRWNQYGPLLIQEKIPFHGSAVGVSLLMDKDGDCVAAFAHKRTQQYPVSGGPSTDRKSIEAPELVNQSIALLKSLSWQGVAMVEWKIDPRDGIPKLMEINPRFWGSLELAVRSGVNFPTLYARAALGEKLTPIRNYAVGIRCRWMIPGEILRYMSQKKVDREPLNLFLKGLPQSAEEWDIHDLRGFFSTLICTIALAFNPRYWRYVRKR